MSKDNLLVESDFTPVNFEPLVKITYGNDNVSMSASLATNTGIAIINAAAYAESEAAIFKALVPNNSKGFGNRQLTKNEEKAILVLRHIRSVRPPLPSEVNPIFGAKTQEGLVSLNYGNIIKITLHLDEARHHAHLLLEASEASRFDGFWMKFGEQKLSLTKEEMQQLILEYRAYKERYEVESLFDL